MACANISWPEEDFVCSICLDVFYRPVSTPCGHNFCRTCIEMFWEKQVQYKCPVCNKLFCTRPDLRINYLLTELSAQMRTCAQAKEQPCVQPSEVPCDVCTGTQRMAVKSCLVCLISYCHTHLEPHQRVTGLKRHQLVSPMRCLQDRICQKHSRILELYCKTDQVCVCQFCTEGDHKNHPVAPLKEEYDVQMAKLKTMESEVKQMIQERQRKVQEIKDIVHFSKEDAEREIADGARVLHSLMLYIEKYRDDFNQIVKYKLESTVRRAEGLVKELEQEIEELNNRSSEVSQLSHIEDHLHFFQTFRSQKKPPHTRDWTKVEVRPQQFVGTLRRSLDQLEEPLNTELKRLCDAVELERVQQYEVNVTLDPETAHPKLVLSKDGKQVHDGGVRKEVRDNPKRFTHHLHVLTRQSFSGRFYFEVQVTGKNAWCLGIARGSGNKKGGMTLLPEHGYWTIDFKKDRLMFNAKPVVCLPLRAELEKVGVFVDYDEGLVSFYDVGARVHIYSGTGFTFSEPIYPVLCPCLQDGGRNSAPMIISQVNS